MVGKTLGHYEILELLGKGGMGEVYLGEDTRLGRKVAIKVLPEEYASDPERLARFEQEARAAAALNNKRLELRVPGPAPLPRSPRGRLTARRRRPIPR